MGSRDNFPEGEYKPMKESMGKIGRPPKILSQQDKATIEDMCMKQCTCAEICAELGIDPKTFQKNLRMLYGNDPKVRKPVTYSTVFEAYRQKGLTQLRQSMYDSAMKGNTTMLIFLAKNWLGIVRHPQPVLGNTTMLIFLAKNWLGMADNPAPAPDNRETEEFAKAMKASVKAFSIDFPSTCQLVEDSNIQTHEPACETETNREGE